MTSARRRRIAIVTPMLPIPHDQTRGRYVHETARSLARLADVKVFFQQVRYPRLPLIRPRSFIEGIVGSDYRLDGVDVEAFSYPVLPVVSRGLNGHVGSYALTPRVARFAPDLVLAFWVYPDGFAALRTARRLQVPCVVGALGSDIHVRSGLNTRMTRHVIQNVDALLTVSEAMRAYAITHFDAAPARVHTIINGFNTTIFRPMDLAECRRTLGLPVDGEIVVYVGRFVEAKGMFELLDAFGRLARDRPQLKLALVGDGVMRERLPVLLAERGLADRTLLPGGLPPDQVATWIGASNLLTLPSWSEGYPNVVVEALACGRPVVATDVGGTREIFDERRGRLIAPRDTEALTQALRETLDHRWDAGQIANGMTRTWDDVAVETLAVCESVLNARRAG